MTNIFSLTREKVTMTLSKPGVEKVINLGGVSTGDSRCQLAVCVGMEEVIVEGTLNVDIIF